MTSFRSTSFAALVLACLGMGAASPAPAQSLSPQGYTGGSMTPSTETVPAGQLSVGFDRQLPGAPVAKGYNYQFGFGLLSNLEIVGRLATNDPHCNMFRVGCPRGQIRDFSGSVKFGVPMPWGERGPQLALGITDLGGAATYFRSSYWVSDLKAGPFDFAVGSAKRSVPTAPLHGVFGRVGLRLTDYAQVNFESIAGDQWAQLRLRPLKPLGVTQLNPTVSYTQRLGDSPLTDKGFWSVGVTVPIGRAMRDPQFGSSGVPLKRVQQAPLETLGDRLAHQGFYEVRWAQDGSRLVLRAENQSFLWNSLDAAGVALGQLLSVLKPQDAFRLEITQRQQVVLAVEGTADCATQFLEFGRTCLTGEPLRVVPNRQIRHALFPIEWRLAALLPRPELQVSPAITSAIGTEAGAFDFDLAANLTLQVPLWRGALYEFNRVVPLDAHTKDFERGRPFYGARFRTANNREVLSQIVPLSAIWTTAKLSHGRISTDWEGWQVDTYTQVPESGHRFSLSYGHFENERLPVASREREPQLASWRYNPAWLSEAELELQAGKYWAGDRGYTFTQRFWYGDTAFSTYLRRSRLKPSDNFTSFFGFQITLPLTPRVFRTSPHANLRGTNQFAYSVETKVFEKDNRLTPGFGVVPRVSETLSTVFNRDRSHEAYTERNLDRLSEAFQTLTR